MTTVKWLNSAMVGAPTLDNTANSLIEVLDACLVNGWGSATIDSLVVASGIATVTKAGHPFSPMQITEIAGAGSSGGTLNGQRQVLTTTSTTYTFDATGIPDQPATGTITHKVAALGWTKPFADAGNVAVYRLNSVEGTGSYLRVDDSGTVSARAVGYVSMSDLNTGIGPFPTGAQVSGGTTWPKASSGPAARPWILTGDDQGFYFASSHYETAGASTPPTPSTSWRPLIFFGDINSEKIVDPYRCVMSAPTVISNTTSTTGNCSTYISGSAVSAWFARGVSGIGGSVEGYRVFQNLYGGVSAKHSGSVLSAVRFPNAANNGMYVGKMHLSEQNQYRGTYPGMYVTPHDLVTGFPIPETSLIDGVVGLPGVTLMGVTVSNGVVLMDVIGPWR